MHVGRVRFAPSRPSCFLTRVLIHSWGGGGQKRFQAHFGKNGLRAPKCAECFLEKRPLSDRNLETAHFREKTFEPGNKHYKFGFGKKLAF